MDKMTKKIIFAFVGMVCAAALILVVYYMISQGKIGSMRETSRPSTEVEKLLNKDLETKYPETPTEVVKLFWRYNKCVYNNSMSDKDFEGLLKQMRMMYDEELLALEDNSWDNMLANLKKERAKYAKESRMISTYSVQKNSTVKYNRIDGRECATVITGTLMKAKDKREQAYEKFLCRQDKDGDWRILGWEQTTNRDEISSLGEN